MTNPARPDPDDEIPLGEVFRPLVLYRRLIWQGVLAATLVTAILGVLYFALQPTAWSATLGFRPVFGGADEGKYPNDLPFSSSDIVAPSIVSQVVAKNSVENYCPADVFRSGLVVQEASSAVSLNSQARLNDSRLPAADRQALQDEFTTHRTSLPREYQLVFVRPSGCASLPRQVVLKAMSEVLEGWAVESEERRGVLKVRTAVLSPEVFVLPNLADTSLLVRADLVRAAIVRVIANIAEVQRLPGSELVRAGKSGVALAEVRARLEDLMHARLDPLIGMAGRGLGRDSIQWVAQALETASTQLRAAEARAEAYRQALREYSGIPMAPAARNGSSGGTMQPTDVQTLSPQIDMAFIEGILALSEANTTFRQEITRRVIDASMEAANRTEVVEHYRGLLASMKGTGGESLSTEQISARLLAITTEATETTRLFNEIYEEFSRVAFRAGPSLYRLEQPTQVTVLRAFNLRSYLFLVLGVAFASPVVIALVCLVLFHLRRFVKSALPA